MVHAGLVWCICVTPPPSGSPPNAARAPPPGPNGSTGFQCASLRGGGGGHTRGNGPKGGVLLAVCFSILLGLFNLRTELNRMLLPALGGGLAIYKPLASAASCLHSLLAEENHYLVGSSASPSSGKSLPLYLLPLHEHALTKLLA